MSKESIVFPCLECKLVAYELLQANNYNPNNVPKDKMELLEQSIIDNGFCFPIVTIWDEETEKYIIVDGFHRYTIAGPDWLNLEQVPIVVLKHNISQRMAATVQFNKARGVHSIDGDASIVRSLLEQGLQEYEIAEHLGISVDTIYRYKQLTGLIDLFKDVEYSASWEIGEFNEECNIKKEQMQ